MPSPSAQNRSRTVYIQPSDDEIEQRVKIDEQSKEESGRKEERAACLLKYRDVVLQYVNDSEKKEET